MQLSYGSMTRKEINRCAAAESSCRQDWYLMSERTS